MFKLETHLLFDRSKAADKSETLSPYNLHCDGVRPVIRESAVILFLLSILHLYVHYTFVNAIFFFCLFVQSIIHTRMNDCSLFNDFFQF